MRKSMHSPARSPRKAGRRHPLAFVGLLAAGLVLTGGAYAAATATSAVAETPTASQSSISHGEKLYMANCATCHGMDATGTSAGPSLIGVGAASVDFQVGTGRMPLAMSGPQAMQKPPQFTESDTQDLANYIASLAPGPAEPDPAYLDAKGDAAKGAEIFRVNCAMCHNVAAAGGALTEGKFAPALQGVSAKHIYEAMVTGPQNMPVFSDMNITPNEKRDIITYLKYIENEPSPGGYTLGSIGPVSEGLFVWIFGLGGAVALAVWITARPN